MTRLHFFREIASYEYWFIFRIGLILFTSVQLGAILQIKLLPYANSKLYASPKVYDESRVRQMCKEITFFDACMFNKNNGADKNARKPYTCRPNHEKWMKSTQVYEERIRCAKSAVFTHAHTYKKRTKSVWKASKKNMKIVRRVCEKWMMSHLYDECVGR